jgi:hypothetical protein
MILIQNPNPVLYSFPTVKELLEKEVLPRKNTDFYPSPHLSRVLMAPPPCVWEFVCVSACPQNVSWEKTLETISSALSQDSQRTFF